MGLSKLPSDAGEQQLPSSATSSESAGQMESKGSEDDNQRVHAFGTLTVDLSGWQTPSQGKSMSLSVGGGGSTGGELQSHLSPQLYAISFG